MAGLNPTSPVKVFITLQRTGADHVHTVAASLREADQYVDGLRAAWRAGEWNREGTSIVIETEHGGRKLVYPTRWRS